MQTICYDRGVLRQPMMEEISKMLSFMYNYVAGMNGLRDERTYRGMSNPKTENPTIDSYDN